MKFQIKTVARMTGIPRNTLLAWERRYAVVAPSRAPNGYRLYTESDVDLLRTLKTLTINGFKVSEAMNLIRTNESTSNAPVQGTLPRIILLDPPLRVLIANVPAGTLHFTVVDDVENIDQLLTASGPMAHQLTVVRLESLGEDPCRQVRRIVKATNGLPLLVLYHFATRALQDQLIKAGAHLSGGPIQLRKLHDEVIKLTQSSFGPPLPDPAAQTDPATRRFPPRAPRRFSDITLARVIAQLPSIECECPNHISSLVSAMVAFEEYSAKCASRSPEDRLLHERLARGTGYARSVMEQLLLEVCEADGIELPQ